MATAKTFRQWRLRSAFFRPTDQRGANTVRRDRDESTLDKVWGLKPTYVGYKLRKNTARN